MLNRERLKKSLAFPLWIGIAIVISEVLSGEIFDRVSMVMYFEHLIFAIILRAEPESLTGGWIPMPIVFWLYYLMIPLNYLLLSVAAYGFYTLGDRSGNASKVPHQEYGE